MKKAWVLSYPLSAQLIRLGGCPGWSETLLAAPPFCWFCYVTAPIMVSLPFNLVSYRRLYFENTSSQKNKLLKVRTCAQHIVSSFPFRNVSQFCSLQQNGYLCRSFEIICILKCGIGSNRLDPLTHCFNIRLSQGKYILVCRNVDFVYLS